MIKKNEIVENWLPRYTGVQLNDFGKYILLTNFNNYVTIFADQEGVQVNGKNKAMPNATSGNISIINLKKVFSNTNLPTYFKTDHHWNSFGAYKAYEAIMKSNPSMSSYFVKFNFKNKKTNGGDLINSMKLNNFIAEENNYEPESSFVPNCEEKIIDLKYKKFKHPTIVRECNNSKSKRKAVIFHDSFGPYFTNYFDVSFIQTIYIWDYPSTEEYKIIVNNLNPDIIIEQRVERHIAPFKPS